MFVLLTVRPGCWRDGCGAVAHGAHGAYCAAACAAVSVDDVTQRQPDALGLCGQGPASCYLCSMPVACQRTQLCGLWQLPSRQYLENGASSTYPPMSVMPACLPVACSTTTPSPAKPLTS